MATGLDGIPAWFLRLGAPIFAAPLAKLFNQTIMEGTVPQQWKTAAITPIPKVPRPTKPSEFRPPDLDRHPMLSQLLICTHAQQATAYLNMLMTPTWLCPQRTQARDAKKSSKSASGQLRII